MVQAAFGASYYNHPYQRYQAEPAARRQYQVGPAATPVYTTFNSQNNPNDFIDDFSDFDFSKLTNLGLGGFGELTGQLKTMLPASGNVVTDNGAGPVVNTKFGIVFILALLSLFHTDFL